MNKKIIELLYRSFDDKLTEAEQQGLDQALSDSKELREEKSRIAQMRTAISDSGQVSFKPFFAEKVIRRIREAQQAQESFFDSLIYVFRPVVIAVTILLLALMSFNLFNSNHKTVATAFGEPEITLEHALDPTVSLVME
jgi:hypothetical protein